MDKENPPVRSVSGDIPPGIGFIFINPAGSFINEFTAWFFKAVFSLLIVNAVLKRRPSNMGAEGEN
jgi:hypothetical protein